MKKTECILAIDIGTSATKAVIFDASGKTVFMLRKAYSINFPRIGWSEQNPDDVFLAVLNAIQESYQTKPENVEIAGIAFSSQMYSILAVDREGNALTNSLTWADRRSAEVAQTLSSHPEAHALYQRTGCPLDSIYPFSKIRWLQAHVKNRNIAKFISIKEYVLYRLLGKYVVDWSIASATGFFDIHRHTWDAQALDLIGISPQQLSELVSPRRIFTKWNTEAAQAALIPQGTPCIIGGGDGPLASIGVGASVPGSLAVNVGTSAAARALLSAPLVDPHGRLWTYVADEDAWVIGGITSSGGVVYEWFLKNFASGDDEYEAINAEIAAIPPGAEKLLFIPYLEGEQCPVWDPAARGSFLGIALKHGRAHFIRAVFEGIARSIYRMVESIEATIPHPIDEIRITGGLSASSAWLRIAADMFGCRFLLPESTEGSAKGAAVLAMKALGMPENADFHDHYQQGVIITPDTDRHQFYMAQYQQFSTLLNAIKAVG